MLSLSIRGRPSRSLSAWPTELLPLAARPDTTTSRRAFTTPIVSEGALRNRRRARSSADSVATLRLYRICRDPLARADEPMGEPHAASDSGWPDFEGRRGDRGRFSDRRLRWVALHVEQQQTVCHAHRHRVALDVLDDAGHCFTVLASSIWVDDAMSVAPDERAQRVEFYVLDHIDHRSHLTPPMRDERARRCVTSNGPGRISHDPRTVINMSLILSHTRVHDARTCRDPLVPMSLVASQKWRLESILGEWSGPRLLLRAACFCSPPPSAWARNQGPHRSALRRTTAAPRSLLRGLSPAHPIRGWIQALRPLPMSDAPRQHAAP